MEEVSDRAALLILVAFRAAWYQVPREYRQGWILVFGEKVVKFSCGGDIARGAFSAPCSKSFSQMKEAPTLICSLVQVQHLVLSSRSHRHLFETRKHRGVSGITNIREQNLSPVCRQNLSCISHFQGGREVECVVDLRRPIDRSHLDTCMDRI